MLLRQHMEFHSSSDHKITPCIHYVETFPSVLQDMPWVHQEKHKVCACAKQTQWVVLHSLVLLENVSPFLAIPVCLVTSMQLSDVASMREEVKRICHQQAIVNRRFKCVQVVYGAAGQWLKLQRSTDVSLVTNLLTFITAGCGKSHFIKQQLKKSSYSVTVAINEGFKPQKAIQRLLVLPKDERNCAIFFNFHLIPPVGVSILPVLTTCCFWFGMKGKVG